MGIHLESIAYGKELKWMDRIQEAKNLFNETWDLMEKANRTEAEDRMMLHKTHTSCYLWQSAGKPVNNARGEWQVSRVYSVLKMGVPALLHGKASLDICLENGITGLDLAFGYEAAARAYALLGDAEASGRMQVLGIDAAGQIESEGDRKYALGELQSI